MTDEQKKQIVEYRAAGKGYGTISKELAVPINTVKSFCRRNELKTAVPSDSLPCAFCGKAVRQTKGRKKKRFCCDGCRMKWWSEHPEERSPGKNEHECKNCGKVFFNRRIDAAYCSRECYAAVRRKEPSREKRTA